jgi:hypothetical protein
MSTALWFGGLFVVVAGAALISARARGNPDAVARREIPAAAALAVALLSFSAIWIWGGGDASRGHDDRRREGIPVRLRMQAVTVDIGDHLHVGTSDDVDLRLPAIDGVPRGRMFELAPPIDAMTIAIAPGFDAVPVTDRDIVAATRAALRHRCPRTGVTSSLDGSNPGEVAQGGGMADV